MRARNLDLKLQPETRTISSIERATARLKVRMLLVNWFFPSSTFDLERFERLEQKRSPQSMRKGTY